MGHSETGARGGPSGEGPPPKLGAGRLICFLGIDGSGKTTLLETLSSMHPEAVTVHWMLLENLTRVPTLDPGIGPHEVLRRLGPYSRAALLTYLAAVECETMIEPALRQGRTVLVDSYWYKFAAKMKVSEGAASFLYTACAGLREPDLVVFVDTPVEVAFARKSSFNWFDETPGGFLEFQSRVRLEMLRLVGHLPQLRLDGRRPAGELARQVGGLLVPSAVRS